MEGSRADEAHEKYLNAQMTPAERASGFAKALAELRAKWLMPEDTSAKAMARLLLEGQWICEERADMCRHCEKLEREGHAPDCELAAVLRAAGGAAVMSDAEYAALADFDPRDPTQHGRPLWIVYGELCAPSLICAKLRAYTATTLGLLPVGVPGPRVCIWGYSVYEGKPGFRTLGIDVDQWIDRSGFVPIFCRDQESAIGVLRDLTTPDAAAL